MFALLLVIVLIIIAYLVFKENSSEGDKFGRLIGKIKRGETNIKTSDPIKDYINLRQCFNFNKELSKEDILELKVEVL